MVLSLLLTAAMAAVPASTLSALQGRSVVLTDSAGSELSGEITSANATNLVLITPEGQVLTVPVQRVESVRLASGTSTTPARAATAAPGGDFDEGYIEGREAAKSDRVHGVVLPATLGAGAGLACGVFGIPIMAVSYALAPAEPKRGPWTEGEESYQEGYTEGYAKTLRRRRLATSIGSAVVFGAASTALILAL